MGDVGREVDISRVLRRDVTTATEILQQLSPSSVKRHSPRTI